jgi:serine/threonine protein kinase
MPTAPTSSPELIDLIRKSGLVSPDKLAGLSDLALPEEAPKAAATLVAQGFITRFQAQQLLAGRHRGFRLGTYVIQDILGRGGMGAVYLAEHTDLHRKVAIKVLVPGKDEDQKLALERFLREARAAAALDHPNIVRIFDVSRHNEVPYLVMEYVEGQTLQHVLDHDGPIHYQTATDYIAQAAAGLQHAHEKHFVHRDIKPGNLMLDTTGTVKILDMGLARSADSQDKLTERLDNGAVVGTADFIAPEQALNQPAIDGRADIYSLGATFFALLIGKPPFEGNTTQKLLQHQLRSAPKLASLDRTLPKGLSAVVAKMLAKKPADRYQIAAEVIAALTPWLANSSRILAALSRTSLAQGADIQAALSEIARGSSRRLASRTADEDGPDSGRVDPSETGRETTSVASSATTREPRTSPTGPRKKVLLYAAIGTVLLAAGGLGGWLAFGGGNKNSGQQPDNRSRAEQEKQPALPGTGSPDGKGEPAAPEKVLFNLAAVDLPAFKNTRTGFDKTAGMDSPFIRGVYFAGYKKETVSEWTCGPVDGRQAIGFTNVNDVVSAQIGIDLEKGDGVGLKLEPGQKVRLRVTYRTAGKAKGMIYFQTFGDWSMVATAQLPNSNDQWKMVELVATRGDKPIRCVIDLQEHGAGNTLYVRTVTVTTVGKGAPAAPDSLPADTDLSTWGDGPSVWTLDVAKIPAFRVKKEQFNRTGGEPEKLPAGVTCQSWKEGAVGEFRREQFDGVPVLSLTNLNDQMSGQFCFDFESGMGLALQPGRPYRAKIEYATANDATGVSHVQVTPGYKGIAIVQLPNTGGKWKTESVSFVRPPAADKVEVRLVIDNTSVGEGNALAIRSVELVELAPPEKK